MHVCWGNYEGPHDRDVALETILPLIARMNVGALVLPFANPRHAHEVRCLEGKAIADDEPDLSAHDLPIDDRLRAQTKAKLRDAMPEIGMDRCLRRAHGTRLQIFRRSQ